MPSSREGHIQLLVLFDLKYLRRKGKGVHLSQSHLQSGKLMERFLPTLLGFGQGSVLQH